MLGLEAHFVLSAEIVFIEINNTIIYQPPNSNVSDFTTDLSHAMLRNR